jgi:hypothetical protein
LALALTSKLIPPGDAVKMYINELHCNLPIKSIRTCDFENSGLIFIGSGKSKPSNVSLRNDSMLAKLEVDSKAFTTTRRSYVSDLNNIIRSILNIVLHSDLSAINLQHRTAKGAKHNRTNA